MRNLVVAYRYNTLRPEEQPFGCCLPAYIG
jgi:hypothetical protein